MPDMLFRASSCAHAHARARLRSQWYMRAPVLYASATHGYCHLVASAPCAMLSAHCCCLVLVKGVLKIVQLGNACCLRLFKPPPEGELGGTPTLFAECEVRLDKGRTVQVYVESVIDSSR